MFEALLVGLGNLKEKVDELTEIPKNHLGIRKMVIQELINNMKI